MLTLYIFIHMYSLELDIYIYMCICLYIHIHVHSNFKASIQILQHLRQNGQWCTKEHEGRCQEGEKGSEANQEACRRAEINEEVLEGYEGQA